MRKTFKKIFALMLAACMICSFISLLSFSAFAEDVVTVETEPAGRTFTRNGIQVVNDFLSVAMDSNGMYTIGTTGGDPDNPNDNNKKMLYAWPSIHHTKNTIAVDGSPIWFSAENGLTYDLENGKIVCERIYNGVKFTQTLSFVNMTGFNRFDTIEIRYDAKNMDTESHDVGVRILFDTMLGGNDSAPFSISGIGDVTTQTEFFGDDIPLYWQAFDSLSDPTVMAQGSFVVPNSNKPDYACFTHWGDIVDVPWDYSTGSGSNGDSAVAVKWNYKPLAPGEVRSYFTYYGLAAITVPGEETDEIDNIPLVITSGLDIRVNENAYTPNPMEYNIILENSGNGDSGSITCQVELEDNSVLELLDGNTYEIGVVPAGSRKQQTIRVKINTTPVEKTEVIKFHFTSTSEDAITIEKSLTIPALEHILTFHEEVPATCLEDGSIAYYYCETCEKYFADEAESTELSIDDLVIHAPGSHDWNEGIVTTPAKCTMDGVKTYTCRRENCGATMEEAIPATGEHDWGEGVVSVEPSCTANGLKMYICSVCGETKSEVLPRLEHDLHHVTNPATCTIEGVEYDVCTTCEGIFNHVITPKLEHPWDDGVVTAEATCVVDGEMTYTCTVCGATKTEPIPANGEHTWDEGAVTTPATCVAEGVMTYTCVVCGATMEEIIPFSGHQFGPWQFVKVPTYKEGGSSERICSVCGEKETRELDRVIPDKTKDDADTGVEIGYMDSTYGGDIDLVVTNIYDGSSFNFLNKEKGNFNFEIYDITTLMNGEKVQPTGTVLVKLPIPANYNRDHLAIYYVTSTGTIEKMDMWVEGDFACFEAEHFSAYTLVDESVSLYEIGDMNGDGEINGKDLIRLRKYLANLDEAIGLSNVVINPCADVTADGDINGKDLIRFRKYLANLNEETGESTVKLGE